MSFNILDTLDSTQHGTQEDAVRALQIQCNNKHKKNHVATISRIKVELKYRKKILLVAKKEIVFFMIECFGSLLIEPFSGFI